MMDERKRNAIAGKITMALSSAGPRGILLKDIYAAVAPTSTAEAFHVLQYLRSTGIAVYLKRTNRNYLKSCAPPAVPPPSKGEEPKRLHGSISADRLLRFFVTHPGAVGWTFEGLLEKTQASARSLRGALRYLVETEAVAYDADKQIYALSGSLQASQEPVESPWESLSDTDFDQVMILLEALLAELGVPAGLPPLAQVGYALAVLQGRKKEDK